METKNIGMASGEFFGESCIAMAIGDSAAITTQSGRKIVPLNHPGLNVKWPAPQPKVNPTNFPLLSGEYAV